MNRAETYPQKKGGEEAHTKSFSVKGKKEKETN